MNDYEVILFILFVWLLVLTLSFIEFAVCMLKVCKKQTESINELRQQNFETEERSYIEERIDKTNRTRGRGMTAEEKQKFKEHIKDYTEAQIIGWLEAMSFMLLLDETTEKLRNELFDMINICIEVIKEESYDKGLAEKEVES